MSTGEIPFTDQTIANGLSRSSALSHGFAQGHGTKRLRDDVSNSFFDSESFLPVSQKRARPDLVYTTADVNPESSYIAPAYDSQTLALYNRLPDTDFALYHPHLAPTHPNPGSQQFEPVHTHSHIVSQSLPQYQQQPSYWGLPAQHQHQQHQHHQQAQQPLAQLSSQPHLQSAFQPHPQPQSLPQTPQQYYTMPADHVQNASYPTNTDWWQPRPSPSNAVLENWNYQAEEPCVYGADASQHLKLQSLATLDNLSTQIILNLAKGSLNDILLLTAGRDHEGSQAYFTRRTLFDQTRKVYAKNAVFIDMHTLPAFTASQQEVVRKANRAIFISSILEGHDISFFDLDSRFMETFVCPGQRLLKWQGTIFLELKTQAYIAALMNNDGPSDSLLDELFPNDLADQLLSRHPDAPNLAPSEQDFLDRARARKQYLFDEPPYDAYSTLPRKYGWHDFLREFAVALSKNVEAIINNPARTPVSQPGVISPSIRGRGTPGRFGSLSSPTVGAQDPNSGHGDHNGAQQQRSPPQPDQETSEIGQSRSSPKARSKPKTGASATQRQPWKQEEEDALMAGLAEVKGPHWSQILSLYGRGGSMSEVLKDRNQIQLKDKARNLKLYYLKMGKEVPECLRGVTGELRKRGGARVRAALGLTDDDGPPTKKGSRSGTPLDPSLKA
ncbi:hypothetical protein KCU81_g5737, partial [Aureobasidium melanogenum]|uniref:HTH myb-type domain-containing protein n=1 Tax=Aureobasidium melanogenum (strain CBS 110374) TaxID=1043003 RepID=A0A074WQV7_AURM1